MKWAFLQRNHLYPKILTVATGMEEQQQLRALLHQRHALDQENLPGAKVSGGVSNISFSFPATTRCAKPCTARSFSMPSRPHGHGHRDAGMLEVYEDIPQEMLVRWRTCC